MPRPTDLATFGGPSTKSGAGLRATRALRERSPGLRSIRVVMFHRRSYSRTCGVAKSCVLVLLRLYNLSFVICTCGVSVAFHRESEAEWSMALAELVLIAAT